jgi:hypothetical protein
VKVLVGDLAVEGAGCEDKSNISKGIFPIVKSYPSCEFKIFSKYIYLGKSVHLFWVLEF